MSSETDTVLSKISESDISALETDGAVVLRGMVGRKWLDLIAVGIEKDLKTPGPYGRVQSDPDDPGFFFTDYYAWRHVPELERFAREAAVPVPFGGERRQALAGKGAHRVADHLLLFGQDHGASATLDGKRGRFAAAYAQGGHAAAPAAFLERGEQSADDACTAGTDRVAERAGAAVHVHLFVRKLQLLHGRHGDHGERFVDLEQVHTGCRPADAVEQFPHRADRRGREPARLLRMRGVPGDDRERSQAMALRIAPAHQHQGCRAV